MESNDSELTWYDLAHWLTVGRVTEATLASAIEQHGIWGFDRFGRFKHFAPAKDPQKQAQELGEVFDALAANYAASLEHDELVPVENLWGTEVYCRFGWPQGKEPDFVAIAAGQGPAPRPAHVQRAADAKRAANDLRLIGALMDFIRGDYTPQPHPHYANQAQLIELLTTKMAGYPGFSKRKLEATFAQARRALDDTRDL
ncbi:hypothetical protein ACT80S_00160 [Ramlibacter sp. MAHUQ-53]|uniref:hypothetical protein n=1 Tax=unclassified Ramlibacter TaxID=2617605 RepID=UPI003630FB8D